MCVLAPPVLPPVLKVLSALSTPTGTLPFPYSDHVPKPNNVLGLTLVVLVYNTPTGYTFLSNATSISSGITTDAKASSTYFFVAAWVFDVGVETEIFVFGRANDDACNPSRLSASNPDASPSFPACQTG